MWEKERGGGAGKGVWSIGCEFVFAAAMFASAPATVRAGCLVPHRLLFMFSRLRPLLDRSRDSWTRCAGEKGTEHRRLELLSGCATCTFTSCVANGDVWGMHSALARALT